MIDAWTGPVPSPQQFPRNYAPGDGIKKLLDKIAAIETELRDVRSHLPGSGGIGEAMLASPVITDLANRTGRTASVAGSLTLTSTAVATNGAITWGATATPTVTFTTPYSTVMVMVGALATANSLVIGRSMFGYLAYSLNGATPNIDYQQWPSVNAANPQGGSSFTQNLFLGRLVTVTPNVPQTLAARYGFDTVATAVAGMTAVFSGRFIVVTPIP